MAGKEQIEVLIDQLESEIDGIVGVAEDLESSAKALQKFRILEKTVEELQGKKVPVPPQMLELLSGLKQEAAANEGQRALLGHIHGRLSSILARLPRMAPIVRRKSGSIPRERYQELILEILDDRGGQAKKSLVLGAVQQRLADDFSTEDEELLAGGKPRWQRQLEKAQAAMILEGLLLDTGPPGVWLRPTH
jgi:hypothetical protein